MSAGYVKWLRSGANGKRVQRLEDDGQRWRWWLAYGMANASTFPGLMANASLQPTDDLTIVSSVYKSKEFPDIEAKLAQWPLDRAAWIRVGLVAAAQVQEEIYLWHIGYHSKQDKFSARDKTKLAAFLRGPAALADDELVLYISLLDAFRPKGVDLGLFGLSETSSFAATDGGANGHPSLLAQEKPLEITTADLEGIRVRVNRALVDLTKPKRANPNVKRFIDWWVENYPFGQYVVNGAKDAAQVKRALGSIEIEELKKRAKHGWENRREYLLQRCRSLAGFVSVVNELTPAEPQAGSGIDYDGEAKHAG